MVDKIKVNLAGFEDWREYDFNGRTYRIDKPIAVEFADTGLTHYVTGGDGILHCVPAPGQNGCVIRIKGRLSA